jgi:sugar phosphate isomerase/epimerase
MSRIPIALQLYSVRHDFQRDPLGTLKAVARMGYDGVEFAGAPQHRAEDLRAWLKEAGLVGVSWHVPFALMQDDKLAETIAFHRTLGNHSLIIPGIPKELVGTREKWLKMAAFFNQLAAKLAPQGMFTGYHNHHTEFTPLEGGETAWDIFFGHTGPEVVMQFDLGNALAGGGESVPILKAYPGRAKSVHLKPYTIAAGRAGIEAGFRPIIGEDDIPWAQVFRLCESSGGTQWYIVEYESDAFPPLEAVERCLKALKGMGK